MKSIEHDKVCMSECSFTFGNLDRFRHVSPTSQQTSKNIKYAKVPSKYKHEILRIYISFQKEHKLHKGKHKKDKS